MTNLRYLFATTLKRPQTAVVVLENLVTYQQVTRFPNSAPGMKQQ